VQVRLWNVIKHARLSALYLSAFQRSRAGSLTISTIFLRNFSCRAAQVRLQCDKKINGRHAARHCLPNGFVIVGMDYFAISSILRALFGWKREGI
jgi:hypothetical protein